MSQSVLSKAIALILLIAVGYALKRKFADPSSVTTLRALILTVALPATIFLSTIDIDTQLNLVLLPSFALGVNLSLMLVGIGLAQLLWRSHQTPKARSLMLLFPSLAPGLTVYPFIEQFLGRSGLAWVALADMGNKLFVLVGLYALAMYWCQRQTDQGQSSASGLGKPQRRGFGLKELKTIGRFLVTEPVNGAIVLGLVLAGLGIGTKELPLAVVDCIQKLALCSTPLILVYVGVSLKLRKLQFGTLLLVLVARAGVGFLISAAAIVLLKPQTPEAIALFISLPQASCSLWPLLHATAINQRTQSHSTTPFFDVDFATALLALSFPFSILVLLLIFGSGDFFYSPTHSTLVGTALLGLFGLLWAVKQVLQSKNSLLPPAPIDLYPPSSKTPPPPHLPAPEWKRDPGRGRGRDRQ
jgi:malate permease and related proteins